MEFGFCGFGVGVIRFWSLMICVDLDRFVFLFWVCVVGFVWLVDLGLVVGCIVGVVLFVGLGWWF